MKKNLTFFFILTISLLGFSQKNRTINIGVLADKSPEVSQPLLVQLKNEIKAVVGQEATIQFGNVLENNFSIETAQTNYQKLLDNNTDIILSFGQVNNIMLYQAKSYEKPIIAFGSINSDFITIPQNQKTSRTNNMNYLFSLSSYTKDLDVFQSLFPYKKIGIIVDDFSLNTLPIKKLFDSYFSKSEANYELISMQQDGSINSNLTDIDAVYLVGGFNLNDTEFKTLVTKINAQKLPSFSGFSEKDVENGILASNKSKADINQFFRRIALNVESIIAGVNPSELDIFIEYESKLTINTNTASIIGFPLRYSMLATVDFIGGERKVVSKFSLTILDIMNGVVDKNLSLEAEKKNIELTEQDVKIAKSNYLPDLTVNANGGYVDPKLAEISRGQNPEFSTAGNIVLNQLIYSESASAGIDIQKINTQAQQETYNAAELDALLNASVAYFNALALKTNAHIQNQNLQITKRNLEIAEQNFQAGASGKSDVLRFRSQQAQNTQSLIDAGNKLLQAFITINQLLNNTISHKIDVADAEISIGIFKDYNYKTMMGLFDDPKTQAELISFFVEEAKNNAPYLKNIGYNLESVERNYRLNNGGRFIPTVSLQGQYNLAFSRSGVGTSYPLDRLIPPDGNYNVGVNISLPIFQQNQRNINRQTAKIQEDQLLIQKENTALGIETNVNTIVLDLVGQIANIEISKVSEETAKESLELTQNAYQEGAVPVIQLIDAQSNYLQAQLSRATANYSYLLTSMQLEHAIGYFFLMHSDTDNQAFIQRANQYILNQN